eukprot:scaffold597421_cov14-Prasinocladus_malaysianus.AAC.2
MEDMAFGLAAELAVRAAELADEVEGRLSPKSWSTAQSGTHLEASACECIALCLASLLRGDTGNPALLQSSISIMLVLVQQSSRPDH